MIKLFTDTQIIFLPSSEWGDIERVESTVQLKRSMDGQTVVTHVHKVPNSRTTELNFLLTRMKSLELFEYIKAQGAKQMTLEINDLDPKIGYLRVNPFELEKLSRSKVAGSLEEVKCQLSFETTE
jgi:hypothetical protein